MEKFQFDNPQNNREGQLKRKFEYYLKDFPLTAEDLQKPLLDVGVDKGEFVQYLREVLGNKQAVGVESQASKITDKEGLIVGDGLNLPFEDESFEIVTAHNYLPMFIDNPSEMQTVILELLRVTKSGGKMMGDIATPESIEEGNDELKNNLGKEYDDRDYSNYMESRKGAEDLQVFFEGLQKVYKLEFLKPKSTKTVVIIYK